MDEDFFFCSPDGIGPNRFNGPRINRKCEKLIQVSPFQQALVSRSKIFEEIFGVLSNNRLFNPITVLKHSGISNPSIQDINKAKLYYEVMRSTMWGEPIQDTASRVSEHYAYLVQTISQKEFNSVLDEVKKKVDQRLKMMCQKEEARLSLSLGSFKPETPFEELIQELDEMIMNGFPAYFKSLFWEDYNPLRYKAYIYTLCKNRVLEKGAKIETFVLAYLDNRLFNKNDFLNPKYRKISANQFFLLTRFAQFLSDRLDFFKTSHLSNEDKKKIFWMDSSLMFELLREDNRWRNHFFAFLNHYAF